MLTVTIWSQITQAFGKQPKLWEEEELNRDPGVLDRIIDYVITYADKPAAARRAVRVFSGLDPDEFGLTRFIGWDEVRVATVREIREVLDDAGVSVDTHALAVTIKELLQATWEAFDCLDLDEAPVNSTIDRYFDVVRYIIPPSALAYLRYLWRKSRNAPYDVYTDRILIRLGLVEQTDPLSLKKAQLRKLIDDKQPIIRHKKLVLLGKWLCTEENPRCSKCPLANSCNYATKAETA